MDVRLPNGRIIKNVPDDITRQELDAKLNANNISFEVPPPEEPIPQEKEYAGFFESLKGGVSDTLGIADVGLSATLPGGDTGVEALEEFQTDQAANPRTRFSFADIEKAYDEGGVEGTIELFKQLPGGFGEAIGMIFPSLASGATGAAIGSVVPGVGTVAGGIIGAALGTFFPNFGGNISEQAQEDIKAGRPVDIDTAKAALATIPQVALDLIGLKASGLTRLIGIEKKLPPGELRRRIAEEGLTKASAKGFVRIAGAEVPTEIGQEIITKIQAGADPFSEEAIAEYKEVAAITTLTGGLSPVTAIQAKSQARDAIREEEAQKQIDSQIALSEILPSRVTLEELKTNLDVNKAAEVVGDIYNSFDNDAPEKSKLFDIINKASSEFDAAINKKSIEDQKKAVKTLVDNTDKIIKNFYAENKKTTDKSKLGVLDSDTLTSFGLDPKSAAFKRLKSLNIANPRNVNLFEKKLDEHKGKINEAAINNYVDQIKEANPDVKYNFKKTGSLDFSVNTGSNNVSKSGKQKLRDTSKTKSSDGRGVVSGVSTNDGSRGRASDVDFTLVEKAKNTILANPKETYSITNIKDMLNISPAKAGKVYKALNVFPQLDTVVVKGKRQIKAGTNAKAKANPLQNIFLQPIADSAISKQYSEDKKETPPAKLTFEQTLEKRLEAIKEKQNLQKTLSNALKTKGNKKQVKKIEKQITELEKTIEENTPVERQPSTPAPVTTTASATQEYNQALDFIAKNKQGVTFNQLAKNLGITSALAKGLRSELEATGQVNFVEKNKITTIKPKPELANAKELSILRGQLKNIPEANYLYEALLEPTVDKDVIKEARQVVAQNKKDKKTTQQETADARQEKQEAIDFARELLGPDDFAKSFDGDIDEFYSLANPKYVQRPDQITRFKDVKNLKRALQILKNEYGKDLGEVENVLLDTMLKLPNLQTTGFSVKVNRKGAYGIFKPLSNNIEIHPNANIGTIIHEALHATQAKKMDEAFTKNGTPKNEIGEYINTIFEQAKAAADGRFSRELENVFEFVDYALQNAEFQRFLSETPPINPKNNLNSLWSDLVNAIKRLFNFPTNIPNSLLNDYLVVAEDLFDGPIDRIVGKDPLYQKNPFLSEEANEVLAPPKNSNGVFNSFVKGVFNRNSAEDAPKQSLNGKFVRGRSFFANSSAAIQELAQTKSFNQVMNDAMPKRVRTDIIMDIALQGNAFAASSADMGYITIKENGMPEITDSTNTIKNVFRLLDRISAKVGNPEFANGIAQTYLVSRRLNGEVQLNERREAKIAELQNEKQTKKIKSQINKLENAITPLTDREKALLAKGEFKTLETQFPELQQMAAMLNAIQQRNINLLEQAGVYSESKAAEFRSRDWYVPLNKTLDDLEKSQNGIKQYFKGYTDIGQEFKYRGGSERDIDNVLDNFVAKHFWSVNAALRNNANQEAANFVGIRDKDTNELVTYKTIAQVPKDKKQFTATVFIEGEKVEVEYSDPAFAVAVRGPESPLVDTSIPSAFATLFRQTITANPIFQAYQVFNDSISAAAYSGVKKPFQLMKRVLASYPEIINDPDSPILQQMRKAGVTGGYGLTPQEIIGKTRRELGLLPEGKLRKAAAYFEDLATHSDLAQRKAIFEQVLLETGGVRQPDGTIAGGNQVEAVNKAINIINWNKRGSSSGLRLLTHTIPFLNAYIQGMDILINVARGKFVTAADKKTAMKMFAVTSAKIMLLNTLYSMLVAGNDEYENLDDNEKLRSYIVPGTGFKLPIRGELALLYKLLPEGLYNVLTKEGTNDEIDARRIKQAVSESLSNGLFFPALFPQIVKTPIEVATNYNMFTGSPIVSPYKQKEITELQFNAGTSELAKVIGETGLASPLKTDHLIRGTFGTAGSLFLYLTDSLTNQFLDNPRPSVDISRVPGPGSILYSKNGRGQLNQFYDLKMLSDQVTSSLSSFKDVDREKAIEYKKDNRKLIGARRKILTLNKRVKAIRNRKMKIIQDAKLSAQAKKNKLDVLDKQTNKVLESVYKLRVELDLPLFSTQ